MLNSTLLKWLVAAFSARSYQPRYLRMSFQGLILSVLLFLCSLPGIAQNGRTAGKIDPTFEYLIAHRNQLNDPAVIRNIPSPNKIQPREGFVNPGGPLEKRYDCIVYTNNAKVLMDAGIMVYAILPTFVTAWVTLDQITQLSLMPDVRSINTPDVLSLHNDLELANSGAILLHQGILNNTVYKGKGVIVAVFDTGIDWDHPDFRDPADQTKSRILKIWDQTITPIAGETSPAPFGYGVEYTQAQINDELDGTPTAFVREKDTNGHGSHVAGTATGNGMALATRKFTGMAPEADIIIVKGGNGSFSSTNVINALSYLQTQATNFGKPIVLNMSLGGQSGPHDGTQAQEVAVDNFTSSAAGRAVVISAGNDNGINIHRQLSITAGNTGSLDITVPSASAGTDVFQFTMYANDNTAVTATVTTPTAEVVSTPGATAVMGGNFTVNLTNSIDAGSGDRIVNVYITRTAGDPAGTWNIAITNNGAATITMDGWLNYTNASYSATAVVGGNSQYLVGSPGNATSAITVASYLGRLRWNSVTNGGVVQYTAPAQQDNISLFSSIGPRRDNVLKPEIASNGQAVISCLSSDMTGADVVVTGFYHREQGTSMSAPSVAGAVALLLQANPSATASTIKTLIQSNANSDALTGAVPNTTWGYGRLDVYKAAASIFNCLPVNRKTYQYDNSFTSATDGGGLTLSTQRVAVKFTPDINGKVGGAYYHASTTITDLVVEVRDKSVATGNPNNLLGTLNVPVANLMAGSFNYIDLSSLNISVTSGQDYFIILYRSTAASWSIRFGVVVNNRSLSSSDGGLNWANPGQDYRIRTVVYNNIQQVTGSIASTNAADTRNLNTSNQFLTNCSLIAQLVPNGGSPVSGVVSANVWIEGSVPHVGTRPFVQRHYQLQPATNPATSTGRVTLYFTQAEFNAFNADAGSTLNLPTGPGDASGIANLRVGKFSGTSSDGSGMPLTYSGTNIIIDPVDADIVWNTTYSRWEVTFNTTGFSGFVVQTSLTVLPVNLEYFTGRKQSTKNLLNWKVSCTSDIQFEVQRGSTGFNDDFVNIGKVTAAQQTCDQPFNFTDASPLAGANYYRLKITESTGKVYFSTIVLLQSNVLLTNSVQPTLIPKGGSVQVGYVAGSRGSFIVTDATGRQVYNHSLVNGVQGLDLPLRTSGIYIYSIRDDKGAAIANGKLIIQ